MTDVGTKTSGRRRYLAAIVQGVIVLLLGIACIIGAIKLVSQTGFSLVFQNGMNKRFVIQTDCPGELFSADIQLQPADSPELGWGGDQVIDKGSGWILIRPRSAEVSATTSPPIDCKLASVETDALLDGTKPDGTKATVFLLDATAMKRGLEGTPWSVVTESPVRLNSIKVAPSASTKNTDMFYWDWHRFIIDMLDGKNRPSGVLVRLNFRALVVYPRFLKGIIAFNISEPAQNISYSASLWLPWRYGIAGTQPAALDEIKPSGIMVRFPTTDDKYQFVTFVENLERADRKDAFIFLGGALLGTGIALLAEFLRSLAKLIS